MTHAISTLDIRTLTEHDGTILHLLSGNVLHREDGPARIVPKGDFKGEYWYRFGQLHRDDGPAVVHKDGKQEWWRWGRVLKIVSPDGEVLQSWERDTTTILVASVLLAAKISAITNDKTGWEDDLESAIFHAFDPRDRMEDQLLGPPVDPIVPVYDAKKVVDMIQGDPWHASIYEASFAEAVNAYRRPSRAFSRECCVEGGVSWKVSRTGVVRIHAPMVSRPKDPKMAFFARLLHERSNNAREAAWLREAAGIQDEAPTCAFDVTLLPRCKTAFYARHGQASSLAEFQLEGILHALRVSEDARQQILAKVD